MVDIHGSEICRQRIAKRGRDIEVQLRGIVVAIAGRCVDADVVARVLRYDVDQTTSGVAAIQRALRAFENLNSLDIVEREGGGGGIRKIKAVKIGRDGQFGRIASAVLPKIGRGSCRERGWPSGEDSVGAVALK